jgi:hypothetical protein
LERRIRGPSEPRSKCLEAWQYAQMDQNIFLNTPDVK